MIGYGRLHRYAYVTQLASGKHVLDLASGEGFGANMLATTAASVLARNPNKAVTQRAREKYQQPNLKFVSGPLNELPIEDDHVFDIVVCFDIEDATNHGKLFDEVKRLLRPGGLLVVSTPPEPEKLQRLLEQHFKRIQFLRQNINATSTIEPANGSVEHSIAIASDAEAPEIKPHSLVSSANVLLEEDEKRIRELLDTRAYQDETLKRQEAQLAAWKQTIASLEEAFAWHKSRIESLEKTRDYLETEINQLLQKIASDEKALAWRESQVEEFERIIASKDEGLAWRATQVAGLERSIEEVRREAALQLENLEREMSRRINLLKEELEAVYASRGWKFVLRMRSIRGNLMRLVGKG